MIKKIEKLIRQYRETLSYLFFGVCTTLVNIITYFVCSKTGMDTATATVIAWVLSVLFAYLTNRYFVFENRADHAFGILREAISFFSCRLATGVLDLVIMLIFVDILHQNDLLIKILSNILVIILNYAASKIFIFRDQKPDENTKKGIFEKIPDYLRTLFYLYIITTLFLMIFIDKRINTGYIPNTLTSTNLILIVPSVFLFLICTVIMVWCGKNQKTTAQNILSDHQFYLIIGFCFVAVFLTQLFLTDHINFKSGWDVGCLTGAAERLAFSPSEGLDNFSLAYFSTYPNNLTLLYTLTFFYKIGAIFFPLNPHIFVIILTNLCVCISVFLATLCIYKLTKNRLITILGMGIGILLTALSPWIEIPYTDALGMIFPIAAVFCYLFVEKKLLRCFLITLFCTIGYFYKPTILIFLIAFVILGLCSELAKLIKKEFSPKRFAFLALAMIIGAGCSYGADKILLLQNDLQLNKNLEKSMTHYFMMGLNTDTDGCFNGDDVAYSDSFPDVKSRKQANIDLSVKRLKKMGAGGYLQHLIKKNLATYNDGTFAYGREGNFYASIPEENGSLDHTLRHIFYMGGTHYPILATMEHILWLFVLIGICFCIIPGTKEPYGENYIALALLGVSLFLLLFEGRARYLYQFSPLFVVLAAVGLKRASEKLERFITQKNK